MAAPKKGKDLSALKARLAKKAAAAAGEEVPPPGAVADAAPTPPAMEEPPAPAADIPAPGAVSEPEPAPAMDIPAPGEVAEPEPVAAAPDIPAPGEVYEPPPEPAYEPEPAAAGFAQDDGDAFGGGSAFDPDAGLLGGDVEIKPRKNTGLTIVALLGGVAVGGLLGWVGKDVKAKNDQKDRAVAKATKMVEEIKKLQKATIGLRVGFDDAKKEIVEKGPEGAQALQTLLGSTFGPEGDFPKVEELFGWQLASLHPNSIKAIFKLYHHASSLSLDMGLLAGYASANAGVIAGRVKGPQSFAVKVNEDGSGTLVELVGLVCPAKAPEGAEPPKEGAPPPMKDCAPEEAGKFIGFKIRAAPGAEPEVVMKGQGFPLAKQGPIYQYAIGTNPEEYAKQNFQILSGQVAQRLDEIKKVEDSALKALENYVGSPTTDDSNTQSDPG